MLALRIIELLNDDAVVAKLKKALYPSDLADKIDSLNAHIENLTKLVKAKDIRIVELETKIHALEESSDNLEQYTHRPNLRIHGVPVTGEGDDTDATVLAVISDKMGVTPPPSLHDLEGSHRIGGKRTGSRPIIVRFRTERIRDYVYRARFTLKKHNTHQRNAQIFLNEDVTARRSKLAFETRKLKILKKLTDCWMFNGKVMVKDLANKVNELTSSSILGQQHFSRCRVFLYNNMWLYTSDQ